MYSPMQTPEGFNEWRNITANTEDMVTTTPYFLLSFLLIESYPAHGLFFSLNRISWPFLLIESHLMAFSSH